MQKFLKWYVLACFALVIIIAVMGFILPYCFSAASTELVLGGALIFIVFLGFVGLSILHLVQTFNHFNKKMETHNEK